MASGTHASAIAGESGMIDLGGLEAELPVVREIVRAVDGGRPLKLVGGGGSGKTESLITALRLTRKPYVEFDLRAWTLGKLRDAHALAQLIPEVAGFYESEIGRILTGFRNEPRGLDQLKRLYLTDTSYRIKKAERFLVARCAEEIRSSMEASDAEVIVLDEFEMGVGRELQQVEIETAGELLQIASAVKDKCLVCVIHPPARQDARFMAVVDAALGEAVEIEMEYLPPWIERKALELVGITGAETESLMQQLHGLPCAYLGVLTDRDRARRGGVSAAEFLRQARGEIESLRQVVLDRCGDETQNLLYRLAVDLPSPDRLGPEIRDAARRTLFVRETPDGDLRMPPVVKQTLRRSVADAKYVRLDLDLDVAGALGAIEAHEPTHRRVLVRSLFEEQGPGFHLTLVKPHEMPKARSALARFEVAQEFVRAVVQLMEDPCFALDRVGRLESESGDKAYFLLASADVVDRVTQARSVLGLSHDRDDPHGLGGCYSEGTYLLPHSTIGFARTDLHNKQDTEILGRFTKKVRARRITFRPR